MQRTNSNEFSKRCPQCSITIPFGIDPDVMQRHLDDECLTLNDLEHHP